ncbi:MAG TPA: hypothetical protein VEZ40_13275 [Pyrinomonadaceae bacterium]|nr:hypothetical protein [Pyrinomonadaceae bacterium]
MNEFLDKVVLAVLVGIVSNGMFLILLSRLRPRLIISPYIARGKSTLDGRLIFRIKVINRSKYPVTNIRAQLHLMKPYQSIGGEVSKSKSIRLVRADPIVLDKFSKKDIDVNYAYRFVTYEDIDKLWGDDTIQFIRFRITCQHGLSGFGGYFFRDFRVKRKTIKEGDFYKGNTFEIG